MEGVGRKVGWLWRSPVCKIASQCNWLPRGWVYRGCVSDRKHVLVALQMGYRRDAKVDARGSLLPPPKVTRKRPADEALSR